MTKLSIAALVAAGIFAIYTAPSFAAATFNRTPTPPCTVNCGGGGGGEPTSPGDPFVPGNPGDPDDPGDDPKDDPQDDPKDGPNGDPGAGPNDPGQQASAELRRCLALLDQLPEVSPGQIGAIGQPRKVSLSPICEQTSLTDVQPVLIEGGNVFGLEPVLKANELIRSKLAQTAYKPRDVVGIDFDAKGNAVLLVHRNRG
jgi:hypothetical protein